MASGQDKLKAIATLHMIAYASDAPADAVGAELLFAIGYVLEGVPLEQLDLSTIDKTELIREVGKNGGYTTTALAYAGSGRSRPGKRALSSVESMAEAGRVHGPSGAGRTGAAAAFGGESEECGGLEDGLV